MGSEQAARVVDQLRRVVEDAEGLLESGGERLGEARATLSSTVETARDRIGALERELALQARVAARQADRYARNHPWQMAGLGIALGAALALVVMALVDSRRDERD